MSRPRKTDRDLPQCVYRKHGAYWYVKRGKWERLGVTLAEALAEYARRVETPVGEMDKLIDDAMASILRGKANATRLQYEGAAAKLKKVFAEYRPDQIQGKHVARLKLSMVDTPNMANRVLTVMRLVFAYAVEQQIVSNNPCIGVKRHVEAKRTRLLSTEEWEKIHAAAGPQLRIIMELQFLTGQRIGDVLKIRRDQITEDGISFVQQKTKAKLLVRWSPDLRQTIDAAKALSADRPAVTLLRGLRGAAPHYATVFQQWKAACSAAKVADARPNDGRAMSATSMKRQGGDAQALLGHTTPAMTRRYLRDRETPEVDGPAFQARKF